MQAIRFDFNNLMSHAVGPKDGITDGEFRQLFPRLAAAHRHIASILADEKNRINLGLEWAMLPFQSKTSLAAIQKTGNEIARRYEAVISLGIGGSYLGLKAAQDALLPPYYNEFEPLRKGRPRIYFDGNNLDPMTIRPLLKHLDPKKTFVIVISKSGETTETKAAFALIEGWLKRGVGQHYGRQIFAITDPSSGTLRGKVTAAQAKDTRAFRNLPVMKGVGGRFSEFNIGLLHLAIVGVDINEVLAGAAAMSQRCRNARLADNPAALYAAFHTILYRRKAKNLAIMMPFSEALKSTADWYVQLLAESLGKKYARKIRISDGVESWDQDRSRIVNTGRTPIPARGTNDLHSIQQNNIEGENDKAITFIKVDRFKEDLTVTGTGDFLAGKSYGRLLATAQEATEWALTREKRPNCTITIPEISPFTWGALLFFFEMAVAYEGELLGVNAFDQPGVEGYKNYMYFKLRKPGLSPAIAADIRKNPLTKKDRFIL